MAKRVKKKEAETIEAEMNKDLDLESPKEEDIENKKLLYIG